jgi:hypothetical protein
MFVITTWKIIAVILLICMITSDQAFSYLLLMLVHAAIISLNFYCIKCVMDHRKEILAPELCTTVISSPMQGRIETTTYQVHLAPPKLMTLNMETECPRHVLLDDPHDFESIVEPPPYKQNE